MYQSYRSYWAVKEITTHLSHTKVISTVQNHYFIEILLRKNNFTHNTYFGCIGRIAMNLTKRKEFLGPINLDNIDIMQDWVVEEENLLDKDDFDMDWEAIKELLIISSKIITDKEVFYEDNEINNLPNKS